MVALWAMFATTLNVSLRALRARPWLAAALGAAGGPLAYYAGARLGALQLADFHAGLAAIAVGWAWLTPLLLASARRNDGFARR
jgi:non-ribosomal peptide synthetase component F